MRQLHDEAYLILDCEERVHQSTKKAVLSSRTTSKLTSSPLLVEQILTQC
jgi:hypothetical protein